MDATTEDDGAAKTKTSQQQQQEGGGSGDEGEWWASRTWGPRDGSGGDVMVATLVARTATCLCAPLASRFYRFLARFSGRRRARPGGPSSCAARWAPAAPRCAPPPLATLVLVASTVLGIAEACSSRSTPKPRPPSPTARPNITFHTYACPPAYATWYCLNGATCFTVNIGESLLYNCECADGYMGQRCEFKDLDGSYLPSRQRVMLETASIAGGATIAVFLVVIVCIAVYIHFQRRLKDSRATCVDGSSHDLEKRPFSRDPREISVRRPHSQYQNSPDIPTAPIDESESDPQFIRVGEAPSTHRHSPP